MSLVEPMPDPAPTAAPRPLVAGAPRLTQASAELLREIRILDEYGEQRCIHIPCERPLTVFVDKRELVTLMTLGAMPELLVLGYLRNQRLIESVAEVEAITVDWDVATAPSPPDGTHILGTDDQARDVMARVIYGFRLSVLFGFGVTLCMPSRARWLRNMVGREDPAR